MTSYLKFMSMTLNTSVDRKSRKVISHLTASLSSVVREPLASRALRGPRTNCFSHAEYASFSRRRVFRLIKFVVAPQSIKIRQGFEKPLAVPTNTSRRSPLASNSELVKWAKFPTYSIVGEVLNFTPPGRPTPAGCERFPVGNAHPAACGHLARHDCNEPQHERHRAHHCGRRYGDEASCSRG